MAEFYFILFHFLPPGGGRIQITLFLKVYLDKFVFYVAFMVILCAIIETYKLLIPEILPVFH